MKGIPVVVSCLMLVCACSGPDEVCPEASCEEGQVCVQSRCVPGEADLDGDGLENSAEVFWGFRPDDVDSDGDGLGDAEEWGSSDEPVDSDGDGVADGLEHNWRDTDGDCWPDVHDANDLVPDSFSDEFKSIICPSAGVCSGFFKDINIVCISGVVKCMLPEDGLYEVNETLCDGLDNDCDGQVDEGILLGGIVLGEPCDGRGQCGSGVVVCSLSGPFPACSTDPGEVSDGSLTEICDLQDNDCDGDTDEGLAFEGAEVGGPCVAVGRCGPGTVECSASTVMPQCSTRLGGSEDQSQPEVCDGHDNDCDGKIDEDLSLAAGLVCPQVGVCAEAEKLPVAACVDGSWICDLGGVDGYEPMAELSCDGRDNDCDGLTDEEFRIVLEDGTLAGVKQPCGVGLCIGGLVVCSVDFKAAVCSTSMNAQQEICDGIDNDCDGSIDEDSKYKGKSTGQPCKGEGLCGGGTVVCAADGKATCSSNPDGTESQITPELCDGLDNDCDGVVDDVMGDGSECMGLGVCGVYFPTGQCISGRWVCDYMDTGGYEITEASCDSLDNDCDGWTDEGLRSYSAVTAELLEAPERLYGAGLLWMGEQFWGSVFGGSASELWLWSEVSARWKRRSVPGVGARRLAAMTIDSAGRLVVLGGEVEGAFESTAWALSLDGSSDPEQVSVDGSVAARMGHAVFANADSGAQLVFGGWDANGFADTLQCTPSWDCQQTVEAAPRIADFSWCLNAVDNRAYVFGGVGPGEMLSSTLVQVDLVTLEVDSLLPTKAPPARRGGALGCGSDRVVLAGGVGTSGEVLSDVWSYSLALGIWAELQPLPTPLVRGVVALQGGQTSVRLAQWGDPLLPFAAGLDSVNGVWVAAQHLVPPEVEQASQLVDRSSGKFCVLGGRFEGESGPEAGRAVWCTPTSGQNQGTWEMAAVMETSLQGACAAVEPGGGQVVAIGGRLVTDQGVEDTCRVRHFDGQSFVMTSDAPCPEGFPEHMEGYQSVDIPQAGILALIGSPVPGADGQVLLWDFGAETGHEIVFGDPLPSLAGHRLVRGGSAFGLLMSVPGWAGGALIGIDLNAKTWNVVVDGPTVASGAPLWFAQQFDEVLSCQVSGFAGPVFASPPGWAWEEVILDAYSNWPDCLDAFAVEAASDGSLLLTGGRTGRGTPARRLLTLTPQCR